MSLKCFVTTDLKLTVIYFAISQFLRNCASIRFVDIGISDTCFRLLFLFFHSTANLVVDYFYKIATLMANVFFNKNLCVYLNELQVTKKEKEM